jgi:hypothetical protein
MSVPSSGNVNQRPIQGSIQVDQSAELKAKVADTAKGMAAVMDTVRELSQELKNQQQFKMPQSDSLKKDRAQYDRQLAQLNEQTVAQQQHINAQDNAHQAQMGKGTESQVVAEAMAGLMQDELFGDTNDVQKSLEKKMDELMQLADALEGVQLADPDHNYELGQLFHNIETFKRLKRRDDQLTKQLADAEITLNEQSVRETLNQLPTDSSTHAIKQSITPLVEEGSSETS